MSTDSSHGVVAAEMNVGGQGNAERRAQGSAERRTQSHPVEVATFGGSRASDKADGIQRVGVGPKIIWFAFVTLALLAWPVSKGKLIEPGEGIGYYFGYTGGVMMLLMLLYPVRKHIGWARNWGPLRYWFMLHMVFGIAGPTLVLFHSTFHAKSLNASVALYSMLLVALSGIVGRFIYKRIHQGLYGRKSTLEDLQKSVDLSQRKTDRVSALALAATGVDQKLRAFRDVAFELDLSLATRFWRFITFDWRRYRLTRRSNRQLKEAIHHLGLSQGWKKQEEKQHVQDAQMYVKRYLATVQRAAQFSAYERLFRLWHILHTPFVWLLGISGIVHVIAVNMY